MPRAVIGSRSSKSTSALPRAKRRRAHASRVSSRSSAGLIESSFSSNWSRRARI